MNQSHLFGLLSHVVDGQLADSELGADLFEGEKAHRDLSALRNDSTSLLSRPVLIAFSPGNANSATQVDN